MYEKGEYRDGTALFKDRWDAGRELAAELEGRCADNRQALVLAIPSGGVPVGLQVRDRLGLSFDVCIVRKIQNPWNRESGFGAVTLDGRVLLNQEMKRAIGVRKEIEAEEIARVKAELQERNRVFRGGQAEADVQGRTVILTDDGLATGYTMLAAVMSVRARGAAKVLVAVPTAPIESVEKVVEYADEVYSLHIQYRGGPFAVARAYRNWHDLNREEVVEMLSE